MVKSCVLGFVFEGCNQLLLSTTYVCVLACASCALPVVRPWAHTSLSGVVPFDSDIVHVPLQKRLGSLVVISLEAHANKFSEATRPGNEIWKRSTPEIHRWSNVDRGICFQSHIKFTSNWLCNYLKFFWWFV